MLSALRQPLRAALRSRCYATAAAGPAYVPPASMEHLETPRRSQYEKAKPPSSTFYTGRSDYHDDMAQLDTAIQHARRALTSLELLPLPAFARASLPAAQLAWKSRQDMSGMFVRRLTTQRYRRLTELLAQLDEYVRIARAAGHGSLADGIAHILNLFERNDKELLLARGKAKPVVFDRYGRTYTVGKRKESVARVWIIPVQTPPPSAEPDTPVVSSNAAAYGLEPAVQDAFERPTDEAPVPVTTTTILVNNRPLREFFPTPADRERVVRPLKLAGALGSYNVFVIVRGGGTTGQSGAVAHGIAKGVAAHVPEVETTLRKAKLIRRDPRVVERKKTGQPKARKRYAWVKR
ncbi:ribosomal protein S9/S16-domain-containing protein [Amylostereum chailletii]|nr:ribosomal protein S9/S16-domain-containing protein [Amylostereum chailletii]